LEVKSVVSVIAMKQLNIFSSIANTKTIWRVVHVVIGLTPPRSVTHMLKHWLTCIRNKDKKMIFVGVAVVMWAIWFTRKDLIFQNKQFHSFMQAIFKGVY
jgi:hypothetical protein